MARDFLSFMQAICRVDAISIEYGYQCYANVFEAAGQVKYVDVWVAQQDCLYKDIPYSCLQEQCLNQVVRRVQVKKGKRCVAHNGFLEYGNRHASNFPMPKTQKEFELQSQYIGLSL